MSGENAWIGSGLVILLTAWLWFLARVNAEFRQPAQRDATRFKLYGLRDRLALAAMEGRLDEQSPDYRLMIGFMNRVIHTTGQFKLMTMVRDLRVATSDPERQQRVKAFLSRTMDGNAEFKSIFQEFVQITHQHLERELRGGRRVLFLPLLAIGSLLAMLHVTRRLHDALQRKEAEINSTRETLKTWATA
ncbi:MAG: hypothetical protein HQL82_10760 [Magnetococcales bacterium]|nr:hypothetical protein [Magnetococcales bacterium]